jgi:hypothetical protein
MMQLLNAIKTIEDLGADELVFDHITACKERHSYPYSIKYLDVLRQHAGFVQGRVEAYLKPEGRSGYMMLLDDYSLLNDHEFFVKYQYPRDEVPHNVIAVQLILNHYKLRTTKTGLQVVLSEIPYISGSQYFDMRGEVFETMSPNAAAIFLGDKTKDDMVALNLDDQNLAGNFCAIFEEAMMLTADELDGIEEKLAVVAGKESLEIVDVELIARVVKTAHTMDLYKIEPLSDQPDFSLYSICFGCLKTFGFKRLGSDCHSH